MYVFCYNAFTETLSLNGLSKKVILGPQEEQPPQRHTVHFTLSCLLSQLWYVEHIQTPEHFESEDFELSLPVVLSKHFASRSVMSWGKGMQNVCEIWRCPRWSLYCRMPWAYESHYCGREEPQTATTLSDLTIDSLWSVMLVWRNSLAN